MNVSNIIVCQFPQVPEASDEEKAQDSELREAFKQISGEDLEIDAYELRDILNTAFMKGKENVFRFYSALAMGWLLPLFQTVLEKVTRWPIYFHKEEVLPPIDIFQC